MANLATFDLNLLRVLDALLDTHSATRAGRLIGLSQPAVSAALNRLRDALGDPLFIRHGPRMEPTEYALSLAEPLRRLLDDTQTLLAARPDFEPATATQVFRLSGSDFFAEMLMPALADHLARVAPGMKVQLVDLIPDNNLGQLETRDVDIALAPMTEGPGWMEWRYLFTSDFVMVARAGHPRLSVLPNPAEVDLDTFCDLGHVLFSPEGKLKIMGDAALARIGRERKVVMTLPVMYGVLSTVAESDHVALVSRPLAEKMQHKLQLEIYAPPLNMPTPRLGMAWHRRHSTTPAHRWLRDQIADLLAPLEMPAQAEAFPSRTT